MRFFNGKINVARILEYLFTLTILYPSTLAFSLVAHLFNTFVFPLY